ncbi:DUF5011 domain-containing protein, partial [Candidatus Gracilibacteria bacterium]|nr:DUF5011 domain-containing protein [Candidatus Gracilibacteria bacterium]
MSSFLIVSMFQMILSPLFLNQTYATSSIVFTDDVSSGPVQSDFIQIDVTNGDDITSAKWVYSLLGCASETYSSANDFLSGSGSAQFTVTGSDTDNGKYVCVEIIDNGNTYTGQSSFPLNIDVTPPTVNLVGSGTENVFSGSTYVDSGASWDDGVNGSGAIANYNSGTLNTSLTGTYIIEYIHVDVAGNTGSATRTVNVLDVVADTTAPVVTLVGSATENVLSGSVYSDSGAIWTDNVDGTGVISAFNSGVLDMNNTGSYIIEYFYVDVAGNTGSVTRTVNVLDSIPVDTTAPVVTLIGSGSITVLSGSLYSDSGAEWTDNVDGSGTALTGIYGATGSFQSSGSVNTSATGTYTIEYLKVDTAGNTGSVVRTVTVTDIVVDSTPPVVTLVGSATENVLSGSVYSDSGAI